MPTSQILRPSSGGKRDQLLGDDVRRVRPGSPPHRLAHRGEAHVVGEQLRHDRRHPRQIRLRRRRRRRRRPRNGGRSSSGGLRSRSARGRARPASPRRRPPIPIRRSAPPPGRTQRAPRRSPPSTAGAGSRGASHGASAPPRSARRKDGARAGPSAPHASTARSFNACAPWLPPKTSTTGPSSGRSNRWRASACSISSTRPRRPPDDPIPRPVAPGNRVREKHPSRERSRDPVRQPEMSIRLRQGRRDPLPPGRVDHRPRHVAAAAEDDVRPPRGKDLRARARRAPGEQHGPQLRASRPARQARDPERVELVPGLGDEPRLDPVRRAGEADADAAVPQRFGDREGRQDVAGGPAGRDHAPELRARGHRSARC